MFLGGGIRADSMQRATYAGRHLDKQEWERPRAFED